MNLDEKIELILSRELWLTKDFEQSKKEIMDLIKEAENNYSVQDQNVNDFITDVSNSTVLEKPTMEKYGWQNSTSFDEESGWMYEGGEDAYYEALKQWEAQQ